VRHQQCRPVSKVGPINDRNEEQYDTISQTIVIAAVFAPLSAFAGDIDGGTDPLVQVSEGVNEPDASSSAATLFQNFIAAGVPCRGLERERWCPGGTEW